MVTIREESCVFVFKLLKKMGNAKGIALGMP